MLGRVYLDFDRSKLTTSITKTTISSPIEKYTLYNTPKLYLIHSLNLKNDYLVSCATASSITTGA